MPATRKYLLLDVIMGTWGALSVVATANAVVALVDASAMASAALAMCNRAGDMYGDTDCDHVRSVADELLIWPARRALVLYTSTFLAPVGYSIWRMRCSVPSAPMSSERTAVVVDASSV